MGIFHSSKHKEEKEKAEMKPASITAISGEREQLRARPKALRSEDKSCHAAVPAAKGDRGHKQKTPTPRVRKTHPRQEFPSLVAASFEDTTFPLAEASRDLIADGVPAGFAFAAMWGMDTIHGLAGEDLGSETDSDPEEEGDEDDVEDEDDEDEEEDKEEEEEDEDEGKEDEDEDDEDKEEDEDEEGGEGMQGLGWCLP